MCDIWDTMPPWMQEMIEDSFEVKAAQAKGGAVQTPPATGGLADLAKDDDDEHDDIPF